MPKRRFWIFDCSGLLSLDIKGGKSENWKFK